LIRSISEAYSEVLFIRWPPQSPDHPTSFRTLVCVHNIKNAFEKLCNSPPFAPSAKRLQAKDQLFHRISALGPPLFVFEMLTVGPRAGRVHSRLSFYFSTRLWRRKGT
jgi:hypothetical protein